MSSSFSHTGTDRPTSIVAAEPSARSSSHRNVSVTAAVERHFVGASSAAVPQRPAASAALFDFDSTGADSINGSGTNSGSNNGVSGGGGTGGGGVVNHPASVSVTPITAASVVLPPSGPERPPPTGAGGDPLGLINSMDLVGLFECPVCMDFALPPILQCQSGHIVCASCRSKLSSCPTCRGNLGTFLRLQVSN